MAIPPTIQAWLDNVAGQGASDLHLVSGQPPVMRIHGTLVPLETKPLESQVLEELLEQLCNAQQRSLFEQSHNLDFSLEAPCAGGAQRFRVNYFCAMGTVGACLRAIPNKIPALAWAGFPEPLANRLTGHRNGLVLVTGVAGSGKTTTLAMLIDKLSQAGGYRIITVEEPVEYVFKPNSGSVVTQREVGTDVHSFADGLKYGLRQDPDIILVGEIRDHPTAQMALSAAETGHLVFATLHTRDAKGAISRYSDLFAKETQSDIRSQLAMSLRSVVSQHLVPNKIAGSKRHLALEVLVNTNPIASAIRTGKLQSIDNYIVTGRSEGMVTMDESIAKLLANGLISRETAKHYVSDPRLLPN